MWEIGKKLDIGTTETREMGVQSFDTFTHFPSFRAQREPNFLLPCRQRRSFWHCFWQRAVLVVSTLLSNQTCNNTIGGLFALFLAKSCSSTCAFHDAIPLLFHSNFQVGKCAAFYVTLWVNFLSKNSILTKLQHFHEFFTKFFSDNFSREIKVVNS